MAKVAQRKKSTPSRRDGETALSSFDLDVFLDKYIWLLVPVLVLVYYWFSTGSTGFYQDDEIGHYRNIRQFWGDPFSIMGNQPKPGWKILLVVPGLFGFTGVALAHCLIAALTVVMTYKLGRAMKWKNSSVAAVLLAVQPLYLQLAFRSYSEITAALFIVLSTYFYYRERWVLAALASSYVFAIRQEFALVSIGLGVIFLLRKQWIPFLALAWTPLLLALIGWAATGNMMWLFDDMRRIGLGVEVPHKPFWHYFETYIFMVGPITLTLMMVGYYKLLFPFDRIKENLQQQGFLFFTFTVMFAWSVISAWDVPDFGANPGHWRYLLSIAPLTALYAAKGLNDMFELRSRTAVGVILAAFAVIAVVFLSRESNGLIMLDTPRYDHTAFVIAVLALFGLFAYARIINGGILASLLLLGGIAYTGYAEKPRTLDAEAETVKVAAEWYVAQPEEFRSRPLFGNHVLFRYFADIDINDKNRDRAMFIETLRDAPIGSIVVWDSHYGFNQFGGDVPMNYFDNNPAFAPLQQFIEPKRTFGILLFEKIGEVTSAPTQSATPDGAPPASNPQSP